MPEQLQIQRGNTGTKQISVYTKSEIDSIILRSNRLTSRGSVGQLGDVKSLLASYYSKGEDVIFGKGTFRDNVIAYADGRGSSIQESNYSVSTLNISNQLNFKGTNLFTNNDKIDPAMIDGGVVTSWSEVTGKPTTTTEWATETGFDGRYLQSFSESDPTVPSHVKNITQDNITNWGTAYSNRITSAVNPLSISNHSISVADASPTQKGVVNKSAQSFAGAKTFNEQINSKKDIVAYADGGGSPMQDTYSLTQLNVSGNIAFQGANIFDADGTIKDSFINGGTASSVSWSDVTNKPNTATRWPSWSEVTSKPSAFTPASHSHGYSDLPINFTQVSRWEQAHDWGDHADAGYLSSIPSSYVQENDSPTFAGGTFTSQTTHQGGIDVTGQSTIESFEFTTSGIMNWGSGFGNGRLTWGSGYAQIEALSGNDLNLVAGSGNIIAKDLLSAEGNVALVNSILQFYEDGTEQWYVNYDSTNDRLSIIEKGVAVQAYFSDGGGFTTSGLLTAQGGIDANSNIDDPITSTPDIRIGTSDHGISTRNGTDGDGTALILHSGSGGSLVYTPNGGTYYPFIVNKDGTARLAGLLTAQGGIEITGGKLVSNQANLDITANLGNSLRINADDELLMYHSGISGGNEFFRYAGSGLTLLENGGNLGIGMTPTNGRLDVKVEDGEDGIVLISPHAGNTNIPHSSGRFYLSYNSNQFGVIRKYDPTADSYIEVSRFDADGSLIMQNGGVYAKGGENISTGNAIDLYWSTTGVGQIRSRDWDAASWLPMKLQASKVVTNCDVHASGNVVAYSTNA